jgi:hypothetical protein
MSAKLHDLKEFIATRGIIEQRKGYFQLWATTLQEMLAANARYQAVMRDYPRLDGSELSIVGNVALAHFLRLKLKSPTLHVIESTIGKSNKLNGYLILQYLVKTYGNTTLVDAKNARDKLQSTSWNGRGTVDTFTRRFMQRLSIYKDSIAASKHQRHTIPQLLATTMPHYNHLYNAVQEMYSKYELEIEELEEINVHVSYIQRKLFRLELTEDNHIVGI